MLIKLKNIINVLLIKLKNIIVNLSCFLIYAIRMFRLFFIEVSITSIKLILSKFMYIVAYISYKLYIQYIFYYLYRKYTPTYHSLLYYINEIDDIVWPIYFFIITCIITTSGLIFGYFFIDLSKYDLSFINIFPQTFLGYEEDESWEKCEEELYDAKALLIVEIFVILIIKAVSDYLIRQYIVEMLVSQ